MQYHINYDGKVYPCRNFLQRCPYGKDRHADNPEDLFFKFADQYYNEQIPAGVIQKLKTGDPLQGLDNFDKAIANSVSPVELICEVLKMAIDYAGAASLTEDEQDYRSKAVGDLTLLLQGGRDLPEQIPDALMDEALTKNAHSGFHPFRQQHDFDAGYGLREQLEKEAPYLEELEQKRTSGYQFTPEAKKDYLAWLRKEFDQWSFKLNVRRLLSQPQLVTKTYDEIGTRLDHLTNVDLLSLLDSCTLSNREIVDETAASHDFDYEDEIELSEAANLNLRNWHQKANKVERHYVINSARQTLVAVFIVNILHKRDVAYGDFIYTYLEPDPYE